jgi:lipoyl(octanoyl) transferase
MRWYFHLSEPASGTRNMALDEALMARATRSGDGVFRVYGWSRPTLSLGRNQRARGIYDVAAAEALGIEIVRRPTGGRALLHHHEVTYSVTMPAADVADARRAYDFINEVLLSAIRRLGVPASRASYTSAIPPGPRPCFDVPAEREIVVEGRKLVGSAQWRNAGSLLQHGSILTRDDQGLIPRLMWNAEGSPPAAATLSDALGFEPSLDEVAGLIRDALTRQIGSDVEKLEIDAALAADRERHEAMYAAESWTWRR